MVYMDIGVYTLMGWLCYCAYLVVGSLCQVTICWVQDKDFDSDNFFIFKSLLNRFSTYVGVQDELFFMFLFSSLVCFLLLYIAPFVITGGIIFCGLYCVRWGFRIKNRVVKVEEYMIGSKEGNKYENKK